MTETQLASAVMDEIEAEVAEIRVKTKELAAQLPGHEAKKDEAWEEYAGDPDGEVDRAAEKRYEQAYKTVMQISNAISVNRKKVEQLRSPDEFDRRMQEKINQQGGIRKMTENKTKAPPKVTAREQGVPNEYLNEAGNFRVGMDARLKSDLVNAILGLESPDALHQFDKATAEKIIKARGWESFVERKREILAEKEKKSQARAAEREQAARKKAEAKAKADEEKKAAAEAKKATAAASGGKAEAKPDPKGGGKQKAGAKA